MNVVEIINHAIHMCGLGDTPDSKDIEKIYLPYLNLVHVDLYSSTYGSVVSNIEQLAFELDDKGSINKDEFVFVNSPQDIRSVYTDEAFANHRVLTQCSFDWLITQDPFLDKKGSPLYFYVNQNGIHVYPIPEIKTTIRVFYIQPLTPLKIDDADLAVNQPVQYHSALLYGLCAKISLDELGGNSSNKEANYFFREYQRLKDELKMFYLSQGIYPAFSTYSEL